MKNSIQLGAAFLAAALVTFKAPAEGPTARRGVASWYGEKQRGKRTANGETFNPDAATCASWSYPFDTILRVTNLRTGGWVLVRVNDRGPSRQLDRLVDLSRAAFLKISSLKAGLCRVVVAPVTFE